MSEYQTLGDIVYFGITMSNPSGLPSLINADETPRWSTFINQSDTIVEQGDFTLRTGFIGTYRANTTLNPAVGYASGNYVEVHASGKVNGIVGRAIIKTFVIDDLYNVNLVKINNSGVVDAGVIDVNVVQVSGQPVSLTTTVDANVVTVSGVPVTVADDTYYAGMKFVKDSVVPEDEYVVQWFKNANPTESGQVTDGALSVYRTSDSTSLFTNKVMNYFSINHGSLRYNEATNLAVSGEPYLAVMSGTIDGFTRVWKNPFGLDFL